MRFTRTSLALAVAMTVTAVGAVALRPAAKAAETGRSIALEQMVPAAFGTWRELREANVQVVNPETQAVLDKLYSQVLSRTYVDASGYRVMLSVAYGDDQRGGLQAHRPEVCYPAQGFKLRDSEDGALATAFGSISVRRLLTTLGPRHEPVTYWLTVGDRTVASQLDLRLAQIRLGLTGQIPDGVLFRVSSIDDDPARAFSAQQQFTADLMAAVSPTVRKQLSGLGATVAAL